MHEMVEVEFTDYKQLVLKANIYTETGYKTGLNANEEYYSENVENEEEERWWK